MPYFSFKIAILRLPRRLRASISADRLLSSVRTKLITVPYVARTVDDLPNSPPALCIKGVKYPPSDVDVDAENAVTSEIGLWEVNTNVGEYSRSYWKNLFRFKRDYNVILHQCDPYTKETRTFVLFESPEFQEASGAFDNICNTLEPLIDDCTLVLTRGLLQGVIVPSPTDPNDLSHDILELMQSNKDAHPDWVRVLNALTLGALKNDDDEKEVELDTLLNHIDFGATDTKGNNALHLAASVKNIGKVTAKATEKMTEEERKKFINKTNKQGKTALHSAFEKDSPEAVSTLIKAGADVSMETDSGNAFHLAAQSGSSRSIGAAHFGKDNFLKRESSDEKKQLVKQLNMPNKDGYTPLMLCARTKQISSVVTFLQAGADPDIKHPETGNTAFHFAAENNDTHIIKALIAFGAEIELQNNKKQKPIDLVTDKDCAKVIRDTVQKMTEARSKLSNKFIPKTISDDSIFLLAMDGGGTRGLLHTQTLMAVYKRMKELQPDCGPLYKYFDYIAGTSAGGLVTLSLASDATLEATRTSLFKVACEVCTRPITFPADIVTYSAMQAYGDDAVMSDLKGPRIIITTSLGDRNPPKLHLMTSYGEARNNEKGPSELKVYEASLATSAAPFYFPSFQDKFLDGGCMANNPTLDAMTEILEQAQRESKPVKISMVVSLGTGEVPVTKADNVGVFVPNLANAAQTLPKLPSLLSSAGNILSFFIVQSTAASGQEIKRAREWCKSVGASYFRLSVGLKGNIDLTESDLKILADMLYQSTMYLLENVEDIDTIAQNLLSHGIRN